MNRRELLRLLGMAPFASGLAPLGDLAGAAADGQAPRAFTGDPDVELSLTAARSELNLLPGAPTRVWRFSGRVQRGPESALQVVPGSYLGPVIRLRRGQKVRIRFRNNLAEPSIVHWHGLDVPEAADGHPRLAVAAGREYVYEFEVVNRAGTYWYHPHPHLRTGAQVYQGLAGLLIVSDDEEDGLQLPSGAGELLCVLQDRRIDADNQFVYAGAAAVPATSRAREQTRNMAEMMQTINGWLGDRVLVNGQVQPAIEVDRRSYRLRLVNGSNARIYKVAWSDESPISMIGGQGGLFERARATPALTLAPGQRADLLLDLTDRPAGTELHLRSLAFPAEAVGHVGMMGSRGPMPQGAPITLMTLRVSSATGPRVQLPERLCTPPDAWRPQPEAPVRRVPLTFLQMNWLMAGRTFEMEAVSPDETVDAGATQVWEIENQPNAMGMSMAHPVHLHGPQFRVLSRTGADSNALRAGIVDSAADDTVLVLPGETVRLQVTFSRFPGLYLYHCHILEHEDMGMMRNFRISAPA